MPDLTITLQGGSSCPLCEVAAIIQEALASKGLRVTIEVPPIAAYPDNEWDNGWDGFLDNETVVIRYAEGEGEEG